MTQVSIIRCFHPANFGVIAMPWNEHLICGSIDGTCHDRERIHPRQGDWYRGDKHRHFALAQVVSHHSGLLLDVELYQGHNNDQGIYLYLSSRYQPYPSLQGPIECQDGQTRCESSEFLSLRMEATQTPFFVHLMGSRKALWPV